MFQKLLRPALVASALTVPTVALMAQSALADKADFWVRNDSSITISELYLSASNRDSWDNDLLGSSILESGERFQVTFGDSSSNTCLYDIRAVFSDGQAVEDYQVNVCTNDYYTFYDQ
jgi:hypothetical protein